MKSLIKKYENILKECIIVVTVLFTFMTAACINKRGILGEHLVAVSITLTADIILGIAWLWGGYKKIQYFRNRTEILEDIAAIGSILLYCGLVRLVQMKDIPRWDAWTYYNMLQEGCRNFDFSISSFLNNFIFAAHPTLGFAGITAIGEFLAPNSYIGVLMIWLAVTMAASVCAYRIFQKCLPECSWIYHVIASCVLMTTPIVLGGFSYYQPDMGLVCFFLFLLYAYLYQKRILMFSSLFLLVMTKETGIIAAAGFWLGALVGKVVSRERASTIKEKVIEFFKEPLGFAGGVTGILVILYFGFYIFSGNKIWSYAGSGFRIDPEYIIYQCKQYFILNFAWVIWIGNLVLLFLQYRKRRGKTKNNLYFIEIISVTIGAMLSHMLFFCIFVTFPHVRYQQMIALCGVLIFLLQLGHSEVDFKVWIVTGVGILFLGESYLTIDPVSLNVFETADTGRNPMIADGGKDMPGEGDSTVYNHQFNYLTAGYNHILASVNYHDGMDVIIWNNPGSYGILEESYYWDSENNNIVLDNTKTPIHGYVQDDIGKKNIVLQKEAVFIGVPQLEIAKESAEEFLNEYYEIRYQGEISVGKAGELYFYVCDLKTDL